MPWPCNELTRASVPPAQAAKALPGASRHRDAAPRTAVSSETSAGSRWSLRPGSRWSCWYRLPPRATFISCRPRQTPSSGLPAASAAGTERHRQAVAARIELVGEQRRRAEARRLDVRRRAGEEHAVDQRQQRCRRSSASAIGKQQRLQAEPADRRRITIGEHCVAARIRQVEVAMAGGQPDERLVRMPACIGLAIAEPQAGGSGQLLYPWSCSLSDVDRPAGGRPRISERHACRRQCAASAAGKPAAVAPAARACFAPALRRARRPRAGAP